jgi:predicted Zn-dependent peptidase
MIAGWGGTWNAATGTEYTTYQLDVLDRYALPALDVLYETVTDTVITQQKFDRVREIVYQEDGGRPGIMRRLLYAGGIVKTAWKKANEWLLPGAGAICSGLIDMESIDAADMRSELRKAYVPGNMSLIVVGGIDRNQLLRRVRATFGTLPPAEPPALRVVTPPEPVTGPAAVSNTMTTLLGNSGSLSVAFRTEGRDHADAPALIVLSEILSARVYEQVRVNKGLSYAPEAVMFFQPDYGILYATADASAGRLDDLENIMTGIFNHLRNERIDLREVERSKRKLLLEWAQGYETNAGFAAFYEEGVRRVRRRSGAADGPLTISQNYEREISSVSTADLERVIARYLRPDRRIVIRSMPTMSYTAFFVLISSFFAIGAIVLARSVYGRRRRAQERRSR